MAEGNFEKLPKWAQTKIADLQRTVERQNATIEKLTGHTPIDEAYVLVGTDDSNTDMPYPRHTGVRFVLSPKGTKHRAETLDTVVLTDREGVRYLRLNGDCPISIAPTSSNGVEIRML